MQFSEETPTTLLARCELFRGEAKPNPLLQRHPPGLVVLVDFVFPWGIEYPVVFLPQGLFTLWCLQMA